MKKLLALIFVSTFLITIASISIASETDEGSPVEANVVEESEPKIEEVEQVKSMKESDSSEWGVSHSARVIFEATQDGSDVSGRVDFIQTGGGVQVVVSLSNVTPAGKHGIHIHADGSCDNGGKAAGGHFNPASTQHGLLPKDGHDKAHTGDMGNIIIDDDGDGSLVIFLPGLSLIEGEKNIVGKAVILHAKEDDFGQPTGNAGSRIGCGQIVLNK